MASSANCQLRGAKERGSHASPALGQGNGLDECQPGAVEDRALPLHCRGTVEGDGTLNYSQETLDSQTSVVGVLGLAGMELTFPIAAITELCFVFVARMVLTTHQCFGYC